MREKSYIRSRDEFNHWAGTKVMQAANWRLAFFSSLALSITLALCLISVLQKSQVRVMVANVDSSSGKIINTELLQSVLKPESIWIQRILEDLIVRGRTVTSDGLVLKENLNYLFAHASKKTVAYLNSYFGKAENDPGNIAKTMGRKTIEVKSSNWLSSRTIQINWVERLWDKQGELLARENWQGTISYEVVPPRSAEFAYKNIFGIFMTHLDWQKVRS